MHENIVAKYLLLKQKSQLSSYISLLEVDGYGPLMLFSASRTPQSCCGLLLTSQNEQNI